MRLLLDTHVLLWSANEPERLSAAARSAITDGDNEIFVSAVSAWEIAVKQSIGKLELAEPAELWLPDVMRRTSFEAMPISLEAALAVRSLAPHHRDPFDRLLIAQAALDGLTIVTRDDVFALYGVAVLRG